MAPWAGPRYRSWASDTIVAGAILAVLVIATAVVDAFGEPSTYLIGLLGTATGTFFGALSSDKAKRDAEVARIAQQAKNRVEELETFARQEHPQAYDQQMPNHGDAESGDADQGGSP